MLQLVTGHYACNAWVGPPSPTAIHSHDQCKIRRMTRRTNPTIRKAFRSFDPETYKSTSGVEPKQKS